MFASAKNVAITGGVFNEVHGDQHVHSTSEAGIHALGQAVSHSAMHDSSDRDPPPRCHRDTRTELMDLIMAWIRNESPSSRIFWLYGRVGVGKSAILQTIAERLRDEGRHFAASFFFGRDKVGRDKCHFLPSTIAYQIAINVPGLREPINHAMCIDPTLPKKSIQVQIQSLIITPFQQLQTQSTNNVTPIVIIDGLDECFGQDSQCSLLELLANAVSVSGIPLRFLIASRPEAHIASVFDTPSISSVTKRLIVVDDVQANRDIEAFFRDGFREIYVKNIRTMSSIKTPWPGDSIIEELVAKASGQFLYATIVLRFIGAKGHRPTRRLESILHPPPSNPTFSELDLLYTQILSQCATPETVARVLGVLIFDIPYVTAEILDDLLCLEEGDTSVLLDDIQSLIHIEHLKHAGDDLAMPETLKISIRHASFLEYLLDANRSGPFYVDKSEAADHFVRSAFGIFQKSVNSPGDWTPHRVIWGLLRFWFTWRASLCRDEVLEGCVKELTEAVQQFSIQQHEMHPNSLFFALLCMIDVLSGMTKSDNITQCIHLCRHVLDECYRKVLCLSDLLDTVPGFVASQARMCLDLIAQTFDVPRDVVRGYLKRNSHSIALLVPHDHRTWSYVVSFLCDPARSRELHNEFRRHMILMCQLSMINEYTIQVGLPTNILGGYNEVDISSRRPKNRAVRQDLLQAFFKKHQISDFRREDLTNSSNQDMPNFLDYLDHDDYLSFNLGTLRERPQIEKLHEDTIETALLLLKWLIRQEEVLQNLGGITATFNSTTNKIQLMIDKIYSGYFLTNLLHVTIPVDEATRILPLSLPALSIWRIMKSKDGVFDHGLDLLIIYPSLLGYLKDSIRSTRIHVSKEQCHANIARLLLQVMTSIFHHESRRLSSSELRPANNYNLEGIAAWKDFMASTVDWGVHFAFATPELRCYLETIHHLCSTMGASGPPIRLAVPATQYLKAISSVAPDPVLTSWWEGQISRNIGSQRN